MHCAGLMLLVCTRRAPPCEQQPWFDALGSLAFTVMQCIVQVGVLDNEGQWTNISTHSA